MQTLAALVHILPNCNVLGSGSSWHSCYFSLPRGWKQHSSSLLWVYLCMCGSGPKIEKRQVNKITLSKSSPKAHSYSGWRCCKFLLYVNLSPVRSLFSLRNMDLFFRKAIFKFNLSFFFSSTLLFPFLHEGCIFEEVHIAVPGGFASPF